MTLWPIPFLLWPALMGILAWRARDIRLVIVPTLATETFMAAARWLP